MKRKKTHKVLGARHPVKHRKASARKVVHEAVPAVVEKGPSQEEVAEMPVAPVPEVEVEEAAEVVETPKERHTRTQDNAYSLYLREIGQTKLLTPQEEIE